MAPSTQQATRPSVAASFPYELVETILMQIPLIDLIVISAHLPAFWRSVLQTSTKLSHFLTTTASKRRSIFPWLPPYDEDTALRCKVNEGVLLMCRRSRSGDEGFLLIKDSATGPLLTTLDPTSKTVKYIETPRPVYPKRSKARRSEPVYLNSFASIQLKDLSGKLVIEHRVDAGPQHLRDPLVNYLRTSSTKSTSRNSKAMRVGDLLRAFDSDMAVISTTVVDGAAAACDGLTEYIPRLCLPLPGGYSRYCDNNSTLPDEDNPPKDTKSVEPSAIVWGPWKKVSR